MFLQQADPTAVDNGGLALSGETASMGSGKNAKRRMRRDQQNVVFVVSKDMNQMYEEL